MTKQDHRCFKSQSYLHGPFCSLCVFPNTDRKQSMDSSLKKNGLKPSPWKYILQIFRAAAKIFIVSENCPNMVVLPQPIAQQSNRPKGWQGTDVLKMKVSGHHTRACPRAPDVTHLCPAAVSKRPGIQTRLSYAVVIQNSPSPTQGDGGGPGFHISYLIFPLLKNKTLGLLCAPSSWSWS